MIETENREIHTAGSGSEALNLVKAVAYDLILLDLKMPGKDGTEILREIRKINKTATVYFVTAFQNKYADELKKLQEDGIPFEILNKPVGREQLKAAVDSALNGPVVVEHDTGTRIRLYTSGRKKKLVEDFEKFRKHIEKISSGPYRFEIIDLLNNPGAAEEDNIFVTPTIVKASPPPLIKVIGDISDPEKIAVHLGLLNGLVHNTD